MEYEIWVEGHNGQGDRAKAQLVCKQTGTSFRAACMSAWFLDKFDLWGDFDSEKLTLWSCRLHNNEDDARRLFG